MFLGTLLLVFRLSFVSSLPLSLSFSFCLSLFSMSNCLWVSVSLSYPLSFARFCASVVSNGGVVLVVTTFGLLEIFI